MARLHPEYLPELGPQEYAAVEGYYQSTGGLAPETRAQSMALALDAAKGSGPSSRAIWT